MLTFPTSIRVFCATEPVDLRRGHDGLGMVVRGQWGLDVFSGDLFVFFGKRLDRCKILFWQRGGFVIYYKRLERGRFRIPRVSTDGRTIEMDGTQLAMLLDGIDVSRVRRPELWQPGGKKAGVVTRGIDKSRAA